MITKEELQAIRNRAAAAEPGPWVWRALGGETYLLADHGKRRVILADARTRYETGVLVEAKAGMPNTDFIAAAREDVPRLVDEVERLQAQAEDLRSVLRWYADPSNWYERRSDEGDLEGWDCLDGPRGNSFPDVGNRARRALALDAAGVKANG